MKTTRKKIEGRDALVREIIEGRYPNFTDLYDAALDESEEIEDAVPVAIRGETPLPSESISFLSEEQRRELSEAMALKDQLEQKSEAELRFIFEEDHANFEAPADAAAKDEWRFFNGIRATADFSYWCKMATWSVEEAVSLCLGKDPDIVNTKSLSKLHEPSPFVKNYFQLRAIVHRAAEAGKLGAGLYNENPIDPGLFIEWAKTAGIEVAAKLEAELDARRREMEGRESVLTNLISEIESLAQTVEEQKIKLAEKELGQTERKTLLAMIKVMSESYRYNPLTQKSDVVKKIQHELDMKGIKIGKDSILAKLRDAHEYQAKRSKRLSDK